MGTETQHYETWDWTDIIALVQPKDGTGTLYIANLHPASSARHEVLSFRAWPWHVDGKQPIQWYFDSGRLGRRPQLTIVAGPDVTIEKQSLDSSLSTWLRPVIKVIRVASSYSVPEDDTPLQPAALIGRPRFVTEWHWLDQVEVVESQEESDMLKGFEPPPVPIDSDPDDEFEQPPIRLTIDELEAWCQRSIDYVRIVPLATGVSMTQRDGHFVLNLTVSELQSGSAFIDLFALPLPSAPRARAEYEAISFRTDNTTLEFTDTHSFLSDEQSSLALLRLRDYEMPSIRFPIKHGLRVEEWRIRLKDKRATHTTLAPKAAKVAFLLELSVGFIPFVGAILDVGHVLYMAVNGENIWGASVSNEEIALCGAFALFGVVFEFGGPAFRVVYKTSSVLFPGKAVLKPNPGFEEYLLWTVKPAIAPGLYDAARHLPEDAQMELAEALYATSLQRLGQGSGGLSATEFTVRLHTTLAKYKPSGQQASAELTSYIQERALVKFHPTQFEAFNDAAEASQKRIIQSYNMFREGRLAASEVMDELKSLSLSQTEEAMDEFRATSLFGDSFEDILDVDVSRHYSQYRERKIQKQYRGKPRPSNAEIRRNPPYRTPLDWATQLRNGLAHNLIKDRYGQDIFKVLGRVYKKHKYTVSPQALNKYLELFREADGAIITLDYDALKKRISPHGLLFNADHILEQRFLKNPRFEHYGIHLDRFSAIPIPYNPRVARQLDDAGVPFAYIHTVKTQLLRRLIPNGAEASFSLQEIYDAYVIVYIYQMGVDQKVFLKLTGPIFEDLRKASRGYLNTSIRPMDHYLRQWPFYRDRLTR